MKQSNYTYTFKTGKPTEQVLKILLDVKHWWSGLYEETITGSSQNVGDEFIFKAGGGAHYTEQRLVELIPNKSVVWLITRSNLSFLNHPSEWEGTKIRFDLTSDGENTNVIFTHEGLVDLLECYGTCSTAWTGYLSKLKDEL